jgi:tetratricopeptide (TPR) repeat protein
MAHAHDDLFAKQSIQLKRLSPTQVMTCREVVAELESAGVTKLLAVVAVDQGLLSRADAARTVDEINRKFPGKHPPLPESTSTMGSAAPVPPPPRSKAPKPAPTPAQKAPAKPVAAKPVAAQPVAPRPVAAKPAEAKPVPVKPVEAKPLAAKPVAAKAPAARPGPALRPSAAHSRAVPATPTGKSKLLPILGGSAAVVVIAVIAFLSLQGGKKGEPPPLAKKSEAAKPAPKAEPPSEASVVPKKAVVKAPEPKVEPKLEPKPPPPPPKDDLKKDFLERLAEKKKEAVARLEEVKREVAQERKETEAIAQATRQRLAGKTVTLTQLSGETTKDAAIQSYTFHGAELDGGGKKLRLTWDTVQPASLIAAADVIFDPKRPQDQFERGRFFVARRMWKEAQAAFSAAAKLGQGFESRVLEFSEVLDRLVSGQGGFRGSARRIGRDGVRLSWDFHNARQLEDFTPGLSLTGNTASLESPKKATVYLFGGTSSGSGDSPLAFVGEFAAELKLACDGTVTFHVFAGDGGGYEIDLGPAGAALFKIDPKAPEKDRRKPVAKSDKVKLPAGKTADVRLLVRHPRFRLTVDGAEALAAEDGPVSVTAEPPKGAFGFGIEKGKLKIEAPLAVQGRAEAAELDRRISDTEVMVRRALDPDLEQIERFRTRRKAMFLLGETKDLSLSSDDPYFAFRLKKFEDITKYEELKRHIGGIEDKQTPEQWKAEISALIEKYPEVPSLYHVRALFNHERQDTIGALADVHKAIELFPDFHEALALESEILLEQQEPEASLVAIRRSLEAKPDYIEGLVIRARCLYATMPGTDAFMEDLDLARKLDPQDSEAVTIQRMLKYQRLGPRELGCRFDYDTPHYHVTTDISPEMAKQYGENLEAAYGHYTASFKGAPARPNLKKPRVAIFNTAENYYTYFELLSEDRGENTLGVFRANLNELVLFEGTDLADTYHTLYHEAVHQFMTLLTPRHPPYWYNEGIAEYMGAIKVKDGRVLEKGITLRDRLPYLLQAIDVKADLTFEKIMNETPREFYSGNVGLKYAQAWAMIHFFYEFEKGRYKPLIEEYFESLRSGKTPRESYDTVFKPKAETLQNEWRAFTKTLKL